MKKPRDFGNNGVNLEFCFEATCASRKRENATNHFCATLSRASQDGEHLLAIRFRKLLFKHLRGHKYGREYVVEVMGYATRQSANTLDALGAQELFLQFLLRSDVGADGEDRFGFAGGVANQRPMGMHKQLAPGFGSLLNIAGPFASFVHNLYGFREPGKIRIKEFFGAAPENLGPGPSMKPLGALAPVPHNASHLGDNDCVLGQVKQNGLLTQLLVLTAALRLLGGFVQSPLDGRNQSTGLIFENVIDRAALE